MFRGGRFFPDTVYSAMPLLNGKVLSLKILKKKAFVASYFIGWPHPRGWAPQNHFNAYHPNISFPQKNPCRPLFGICCQ